MALTTPMRTSFGLAGAIAPPPAMMRSSSATSAMVAAIGPAVSRVCEIGAMAPCGYRPTGGRGGAQPLTAQGTRTDPPVSVPRPAVTIRAPTAAPVPDDEPPAILVASYALRTPGSGPGLKPPLLP